MVTSCEMDYRKFVDFVIAVEKLPQCSRPLFFWHIFDLDRAGVLTPLTINYFFRETHAKLVSANLVVPSQEVVMGELFDLIPTSSPLCITQNEFVSAPQVGLFVSLVIDCLAF
uniref:Serine/threonine-protein phosphatase 2A regulatory subunit B'' subunit gamma n=1 Tax=Lygus hesperus TaxID=30085 RepID=A0A146LDM6_LYGHE